MIVYSDSKHENGHHTVEPLDCNSDEELEECVIQSIELWLNTLSDRTDSENLKLPPVPPAGSESFGCPSKCCFVCSVHKLLELVGITCHTKGCDNKLTF